MCPTLPLRKSAHIYSIDLKKLMQGFFILYGNDNPRPLKHINALRISKLVNI